MSPSQASLSGPSARFVLGLLLLGSLAGSSLVLLDAPLWLFYIAPLLAVPLLLGELHSLDGRETEVAHSRHSRFEFRIGRKNRFLNSQAYFWLVHRAPSLGYGYSDRYSAVHSLGWAILGVGTSLAAVSLLSGWVTWWVGVSVIVLSVLPSLFLIFDMPLQIARTVDWFEHGDLELRTRSLPSRELEVIPCEGEWAIQSPGEPWTVQFQSQESARKAAASYLREHEGGEIILRGHEGTIQAREMIEDLDRSGRAADVDLTVSPEPEATLPYGDPGITGVPSRDAREGRSKRRQRKNSKRRRKPPR